MISIAKTTAALAFTAFAVAGCQTNTAPNTAGTGQITSPASAGGTGGTFKPGAIAAKRAS